MKVYLCWSGQLSKDIGNILNLWLPSVIQNIKPYFTPDDLAKGSRWYGDIAQELSESNVGLLIMTRENLKSMWIMFEAGALSKYLNKTSVCPILFGLNSTDLQGPLTQFQATNFNKEDFLSLMITLNNICGQEQKLDNEILEKTFEMWWPNLENNITKLIDNYKNTKEPSFKENRSDSELIKEILMLARSIANRTQGIDAGFLLFITNKLEILNNKLILACSETPDVSVSNIMGVIQDIGNHINIIKNMIQDDINKFPINPPIVKTLPATIQPIINSKPITKINPTVKPVPLKNIIPTQKPKGKDECNK